MNAAQDGFLQGVGDQADRTARALPPGSTSGSEASRRRLGIVAAVEGNYHTVGVLDGVGNVEYSISGVTAWGGGPFAAGSQVWVEWVGERPIPFIAGGGSGTSGTSIAEIGLENRFFSP